MATDTLEKSERGKHATGPAALISRVYYCSSGCYDRKLRVGSSCTYRGCEGDAHGRGKKYALDHGYLNDSLPGSRKPKLGQESLFPEEENLAAESLSGDSTV